MVYRHEESAILLFENYETQRIFDISYKSIVR